MMEPFILSCMMGPVCGDNKEGVSQFDTPANKIKNKFGVFKVRRWPKLLVCGPHNGT